MSVLQAILDPDRVHVLEDVLAHGADVNEEDEDGNTAMHIAVRDNLDQEVFDILVKYGASLNSVNNEENTPISYIKSWNFGPILKLLRAEKKFSIKDLNGNTVMHWLLGPSGDGIFDLYSVITDNKQTEEGELDYSEQNQQVTRLWDTLLDERHELHIDLNAQNNKGKTILHVAATSQLATNHLRILLTNFLDVNTLVVDKNGDNFLHIYFPEYKIKEFETFDEDLLQGKLAVCSKQVIQKLLCCENIKGETPLYLYFQNLDNSIDVTRLALFLDAGADFSAKTNNKETLLHKVFRNQHENVYFYKDEEDIKGKVTFLVEHGVDVNGQDMFGNTPIYYARTKEGVLSVLENGADLTVQNKTKQTPLLWFMCKETTNADIVETLLERGSDVNAQDMHGNTVLHYAAWNGVNEKVLSILRQYNAKNLKDFQGNLPCNVAYQRGHQHLIEMLCNCPPNHHPNTKFRKKVLSLKQITEQTTETLASLKENFDGQCGEDMSELLELPMTGRVQWGTEECNIQAAVTDVVQNLCNIVSKLNPLFSGRLIQSGSVADGTKVGLPDEFDFVYILDNLGDKVIVEETVSNDPSFIRFRQKEGVHDSRLHQFIGKDGILNANGTWSQLFEDLMKFIEDPSVFRFTNVWPNYENSPGDFSEGRPTIHLKVLWIGLKYKVLPIDIDLVNAIGADGFWPKNARRDELFLDSDKIKSEGAIALTQTVIEKEGIDFRLSALLAERSVFRGLPKVAKDSYIAAKIMLTNELCPQIETFTKFCANDFLTSYMLKTSLLHVLDEHKEFTKTDKGDVYTAKDLKMLVIRLFQKLLQCSQQERLPNFMFGWQNVFTFKLDNIPNEQEIHQYSCYRQLFLKLILATLGDQQDIDDVDFATVVEEKYYRRKIPAPCGSDADTDDVDDDVDDDKDNGDNVVVDNTDDDADGSEIAGADFN